ncbi:unnamed protein product [Blepharisma stoltei]|uniref:PHD and RING finger domain-containing protein 1 n=1 Tax=Blepharisma stoltei TaxID=1481888 RepID=A0AAU9J0Y9_9CILI|nr:unnamed protein product [Blepharisma stoltei]
MRKRLQKKSKSEPKYKVCDANGNLLVRCLVCIEGIEPGIARGIIDCGHDQFCFACIKDWANVTNKCPLCNLRFYTIKELNGQQTISIEDKDQKKPEVNDPFLIEVRCIKCGSDLDEDIMLLCDECDNGFHTTCIGLKQIPELDEWFCDECIIEKPLEIQENQKLAMIKAGREEEKEVIEQEPKKRKRLRKLGDQIKKNQKRRTSSSMENVEICLN